MALLSTGCVAPRCYDDNDDHDDKFTYALTENRNPDFYNEVGRTRSSLRTSVNFVNGACKPQDIAHIHCVSKILTLNSL